MAGLNNKISFGRAKPMYTQVAEIISDHVIACVWHERDKLPSAREMALVIKVNINTVIRACAQLQEAGVLKYERGVGMFVEVGGLERAKSLRRKEFAEVMLPGVFKAMLLLGIEPEMLAESYRLFGAAHSMGDLLVAVFGNNN